MENREISKQKKYKKVHTSSKRIIISTTELKYLIQLCKTNKNKELYLRLTDRLPKIEKAKLRAEARKREYLTEYIINKSKDFRERLLKSQTKAEITFKALLIDNEIEYEMQKIFYFKKNGGVDFYILDFYLPFSNIAVEIDGEYHDSITQKGLDNDRTRVIKENGIANVIRFTNDEVLNNQKMVIEELENIKLFGKRKSTKKRERIKSIKTGV